MAIKLPVWDQRMILLMEYCLAIKKVGTKEEFLTGIGMIETGIYQVLKGKASFTLEHFYTAGKKYGINMNWFFGMENNMFADRKRRTALMMLKEAALAVELELNGKK